MKQKIPVILTAFGNRKGSSEVRSYLEARFRERFPECEFLWALGSHFLQKLEDPSLPPAPEFLLRNLHERGCEKAFIQSLHMAPAAEYHKLLALSLHAPFTIHVSPPLLSSEEDCKQAALAFTEMRELPDDTAALLILHGSSHKGGDFFRMMGKTFVNTWGRQAFYGVLEERDSVSCLVQAIKDAGFSKTLFIPFMLASSYHLEKDIFGDKNSWEAVFTRYGIHVATRGKSMGLRPEIIQIFIEHLEKTSRHAQIPLQHFL